MILNKAIGLKKLNVYFRVADLRLVCYLKNEKERHVTGWYGQNTALFFFFFLTLGCRYSSANGGLT